MCSAAGIFARAKRIEELQVLHLVKGPFLLLIEMRMLGAGLRDAKE
jgi:hypothetical protein